MLDGLQWEEFEPSLVSGDGNAGRRFSGRFQARYFHPTRSGLIRAQTQMAGTDAASVEALEQIVNAIACEARACWSTLAKAAAGSSSTGDRRHAHGNRHLSQRGPPTQCPRSRLWPGGDGRGTELGALARRSPIRLHPVLEENTAGGQPLRLARLRRGLFLHLPGGRRTGAGNEDQAGRRLRAGRRRPARADAQRRR